MLPEQYPSLCHNTPEQLDSPRLMLGPNASQRLDMHREQTSDRFLITPRHGWCSRPPQKKNENARLPKGHERLKRVADGYCRIRYEDFVQDPVGVLSDALQSLGFPTTSHGVTESHTIGGNPDRFTSRFKSIIIDNEWQAHHSPIVTGMTWPLLKRYKYPIRQDRNS